MKLWQRTHDAAVVAEMHRATESARAELARASEGKTGLLLSWAGGALAVVVTLAVTAHLGRVGLIGVWASACLIGGAVVLLLATVRPRIPRAGGYGLVAHARTADPAELVERIRSELTDPVRHASRDLHAVSRMAVQRYDRLKRATDLLIAGVVVLIVALPIGVFL